MIKVTVVEPDGMHPFIVEFSHVKQHFTKKAAIELRDKLQQALDDLAIEKVKSVKIDNFLSGGMDK